MSQQNSARRWRRFLGVASLLATVLIFIATLWPLNPVPENRARWIAGANGVEVRRRGMLVGSAPFEAPAAGPETSCTLELVLEATRSDALGLILGFYTPEFPGNFQVRQYNDGILLFRNFQDAEGRLKRAEMDVDHVLPRGKRVVITLTSGPKGTVAYLDGNRVEGYGGYRFCGNLYGDLILGSSPVEYDPWSGKLYGLAIYNRTLAPAEVLENAGRWRDREFAGWSRNGVLGRYLFGEGEGRQIEEEQSMPRTLVMPEHYEIPHKRMFRAFWKEYFPTHDYAMDILRNILGFIPLGFVFCSYFSLSRSTRGAIGISILLGALTSLTIEFLQYYIPQRESGTTDIMTNTLGAAIGALIAGVPAVQKVLWRVRAMVCRETEIHRAAPGSR